MANEYIILEWSNLTITAEIQRSIFSLWNRSNSPKGYPILNNANGKIQSKNFVAVMGESGCGKTSLLSAISHRNRGKIYGSITVNGVEIKRNLMMRLSGYVPQYDINKDFLTTKEHLIFMCKMKLGKYQNEEKIRIQKLLTDFGMTTIMNTEIKLLSGGERKKLSMICELLTDPPILFCDEPTTGLDSYSTLTVIKTLYNLANIGNKIVVCTIHQPNSEVFSHFSHLILLNSGRTIHHGSLERTAIFFKDFGFQCPENYNPADFYARIVSKKADFILDNSKDQESSIITDEHNYNNDILFKHVEIHSKNHWFHQIFLLIHRSAREGIRGFREYAITTSIFMITSMILSVLYQHITPTSQTAIQDIKGEIFMMSNELLYTIGYSIIYILPQEIPILKREAGEKLYSLSAYYVHRVLLMIPKALFESFLFIGLIYMSVNFFSGFYVYVMISLVSSAASVVAMSYAFLFSSMFESTNQSIEIANIVFLLMMLLAGLFFNIRAFPYMKYLSFFFYANEGMSIYYWRTINFIECSGNNQTCLNTGIDVLNEQGFRTYEEAVYMNYLFMFILTILLNILSFFSLRRHIKKDGYY